MPKSKGGFYAVRTGRVPGVYPTWDECKAQIHEFRGAKYHKFLTEIEAQAFVRGEVANATSIQVAATTTITSSQASTLGNTTNTSLDETAWNVVYCDGACKGNGKVGSVAGVGVWWGHNDPRNIAERCPGDQTNNRAELIAIARVLESTKSLPGPLLIKTDSQYSIDCFRLWIRGWIRSNWHKSKSNEPVKNAPIIRYLSALFDERALTGRRVRLAHVRGHSGDVGNDGADRQANRGTVEPAGPEPNWDSMERELRAGLDMIPGSKIRVEPLQIEVNGNITTLDPLLTLEQAQSVYSKLRAQATGSQPQGGPELRRAPITLSPNPSRVSDAQNRDLSFYADGLTGSSPQIFPSPTQIPPKSQNSLLRPEEIDLSIYAEDYDDLDVDENGEFV